MDNSDEPSLLEYARIHSVATDHRAIDPSGLVAPLLEGDNSDYGLSDPADAPTLAFSDSQNAIDGKVRKEKLEMGKDVALFLSSVLAEISPGGELTDAEWNASLANYPRIKDIKVESHLLTAECEDEIIAFGKQPHPDTVLSDLFTQEKEQTGNDEGLSFPDYFCELPDEVSADVKSEKLDCSKDALRLLQEIRLPDEKTLMTETIELFNAALDLSEVTRVINYFCVTYS